MPTALSRSAARRSNVKRTDRDLAVRYTEASHQFERDGGECMAAIDDVELYGDTTSDGTRTIMARNTTKDKTVAIGVHIGGACKEKTFDATLKPMGHVHVAS